MQCHLCWLKRLQTAFEVLNESAENLPQGKSLSRTSRKRQLAKGRAQALTKLLATVRVKDVT